MKLVIVGFGQCGSKIADEFSRLNSRAHSRRGIEIVPSVFAVNTDTADLSSLSSVKSDYQHRILIGNRRTSGHGVGKINEVGAEIARQDGDKVLDAIRSAQRFYEADAFLLVAGTAGGTGSGSMPVMAQAIKERYGDKPVYAMAILPFEHEETTEARTVINSATCLKATYSVSDAVFLIDNQRYVKKDSSLVNNMAAFNLITVTRECLNLGLKAGLDLQTMIDVMIVSTGGCWGLTNMAHTLKSGRQTPRPPTPPPDQTSAPLGNKDMDLAIEMAERVGANIPVAKFMEKLDTASEYEAISAAMRR